MEDIASRVARARQQINEACRRAGRPLDAVRLMAVTKTQPSQAVVEAYRAGLRLFGENRVQEFAAKRAALPPLPGASWRLVGRLQSNKTTPAVELFDAIDSVDSVRLLSRLDRAASLRGRTLPVLLEINIGGETAKGGVAPGSEELERMLAAAERLESVQIRGLMTVPPFLDDPEDVRPCFRRLRELRDGIAARRLPRISMDELSMGMSHDFVVAVEEGSTCVRVGTALFGARPAPATPDGPR